MKPIGQKEVHMKTAMRLWLPLLLACVLLCMSVVPAYATEQQVTPRYTNTLQASMTFGVDASGAQIVVTYAAIEETFLRARLTVKLEKKVLGLFWTDVGDTWTSDYCYDYLGYISGTLPANGKGTYRATFQLIVYGNQGIADVLDHTAEYKYS